MIDATENENQETHGTEYEGELDVFGPFIAYCLKKSGAYIDFPFGEDVLVVKVKAVSSNRNRIFAQFALLKGKPRATFSCNESGGAYYKQEYPESVHRAYHCPAVQQPYFFTADIDGKLSDDVIKEMIDRAYDAVVAKFPKYLREEIASGGMNGEE